MPFLDCQIPPLVDERAKLRSKNREFIRQHMELGFHGKDIVRCVLRSKHPSMGGSLILEETVPAINISALAYC